MIEGKVYKRIGGDDWMGWKTGDLAICEKKAVGNSLVLRKCGGQAKSILFILFEPTDFSEEEAKLINAL